MEYIHIYKSPLGNIELFSNGQALTRLQFAGQKYAAAPHRGDTSYSDLPVFLQTREWLDTYFRGTEPNFLPPLHLQGTLFQLEVWHILTTIPYGVTMTYRDIACLMARKCNTKSMSAQAVGGAVGHNPISIIVPCHRVVGSDGSLTGYAGGIERKKKLLEMESTPQPIGQPAP